MFEEGGKCTLLPIEYPSRPLEDIEFDSGDFHHCALLGEIAVKDGNTSFRSYGRSDVDDHVLILGGCNICEVLGHCPSGDRGNVSVQQALRKERMQNHWDSTDSIEVDHVVLAKRLEIPNVWCPARDPVEVGKAQLDACLIRDGEQVKNGIGRSAERHDRGDCVLERWTGHDLSGSQSRREQLHDCLTRTSCIVPQSGIYRRHRGRAGQRHADRLAHGRHGVGGEHAGA